MHLPLVVPLEAHAPEADEESEEGMTRAEFEALIHDADYDEVWRSIEQGAKDASELYDARNGMTLAEAKLCLSESRCERLQRVVAAVKAWTDSDHPGPGSDYRRAFQCAKIQCRVRMQETEEGK